MTAAERRARFHELHANDGIFVMPNPWDVGSARLLASLGFEALATTSAGFAWTLGKNDMTVTRDELVAHTAAMSAATDLPLNIDSERCFADDLAGVAETVTMLMDAGAAGCSIEDWNPANDAHRRPVTGGRTRRRRGRGGPRRFGSIGAHGAGREPHPRCPGPRRHDLPARSPTAPPAPIASTRRASPTSTRSAASSRPSVRR